MPRSRQARMTRRAISPRLATRISLEHAFLQRRGSTRNSTWSNSTNSPFLTQTSAIVPGHLGLDVVEDLHRLDQADDGVRLDGRADRDVVGLVRLRLRVERADHRRLDLERGCARAAAAEVRRRRWRPERCASSARDGERQLGYGAAAGRNAGGNRGPLAEPDALVALLQIDLAEVVLGHQLEQVLDRADVERPGRSPVCRRPPRTPKRRSPG